MYTYKVMLLPNNKQKTRIFNTFNKCIECQHIIFDMCDEYCKNKQRLPSCFDIRKKFTLLKKELDEKQKSETEGMTKKEMILAHKQVLFYDVSNDALKQTIKDTYNAFMRCFKKDAKYPRRKKYSDLHKSFYVDPIKIKFKDGKVKLEKIATSSKANKAKMNWIKLAEKNRIPADCTYYNPRVSYDGLHLWLTVGVDDEFRPKKEIPNAFEGKPIGVDLNIHSINVSNGMVFKSVNDSAKVKKIVKQQKKSQRALSRKYQEAKIEKRKLSQSKNYIKNKIKLRRINELINNLRSQHSNEIINELIKLKPCGVGIENLDVKSMFKNKHISSSIQIAGFRKFLNLLKSRLRYYPIEIKEASPYFPSSKMCCKCGHLKHDLKLSDRTYVCSKCGNVIDRDLNAAINLSKL